jgi:Xaa-Pro aminopeptidase
VHRQVPPPLPPVEREPARHPHDADEQEERDVGARVLLEQALAQRPGAVARDVDRRVRESLAELGPSYGHHTGHGIGAAWSEEPRLTPYNEMTIDEDMVLAVEPAVYRPGWGGIRLEHVFVVHATGNEVLTRFEHTL